MLLAGDFIEGLVELMLPPQQIEDTVSPNSDLRATLTLASQLNQPWLHVWKQATQNDFTVAATVGSVERNYPLRVRTDLLQDSGCEFAVSFPGGAGSRSRGLVPVTVSGITPFATGYQLQRTRGTSTSGAVLKCRFDALSTRSMILCVFYMNYFSTGRAGRWSSVGHRHRWHSGCDIQCSN